MVCDVPCVPDRHVLEKTAVCAQDVVGPGVHLLSSAAYATHPTIHQSWFVPWEEVSTQIFKPYRGHD